MPLPRTRLSFEPLEPRENPTTLFTETFDQIAPPALPAGWASWSSDGTAVFTGAAAAGAGGTAGVLSQAGSRTAGLAWHPQAVSATPGRPSRSGPTPWCRRSCSPAARTWTRPAAATSRRSSPAG
jgi:hypothetical protein